MKTHAPRELLVLMNSTEQYWCCGEPNPTIDIIILIALITMCLISVAGNSIALHVFRQAYGNLPALMFAHLATTDIITGVFVMPLSIFVLGSGRKEYKGAIIETICNITGCIFNTTSRASFFILAIISVGRYMAVYKTLRYKIIMTRKVSLVMLTAAWILAALPSFIPFMFNKMQYHMYYEEAVCGWLIDDIPFLDQEKHLPLRALAYFLLVVVPIILPAIVTFFCCVAVILKLYLTMAWTKQMHASTKMSFNDHSKNAQRKAAVTLIIFAFIFVACNGLYWALSLKGFIDVYILKEGQHSIDFPSTIYFFNITYLLIFLNSAINPFIYHFRSRGLAEKIRTISFRSGNSNTRRSLQNGFWSAYKTSNLCSRVRNDSTQMTRRITLINSDQNVAVTLQTCQSLQLDNEHEVEIVRTKRSISLPDKLMPLSPSLRSLSPNFEMRALRRPNENEKFTSLYSVSDDI